MIINALNSNVNVFMADFEDSLSPTWENIQNGMINMRDAAHRTISFQHRVTLKKYNLNSNPATLMCRVRGIQASRELYKNLFEAPIVFLIFCLCAFTVNNVTLFNLILAWLYVVLRIWHYYVRTVNPKISKRRVPFQYSLLVTFILWIDLFIFLLK